MKITSHEKPTPSTYGINGEILYALAAGEVGSPEHSLGISPQVIESKIKIAQLKNDYAQASDQLAAEQARIKAELTNAMGSRIAVSDFPALEQIMDQLPRYENLDPRAMQQLKHFIMGELGIDEPLESATISQRPTRGGMVFTITTASGWSYTFGNGQDTITKIPTESKVEELLNQ